MYLVTNTMSLRWKMSKDITYLSEIRNALQELNGEAHIKEICDVIERRNILPNISTNPSWRNNVSTEITTHCKEMSSYRSYNPNLFYSVYGKGEGYWGLCEFQSDFVEVETPIIMRQIDLIRNNSELNTTQKEMLIKARVGQGLFRKNLIEKYGKCVITGIDDQRLLLASHIKPWRSSNNQERLSPENGLLLSPIYDKLFDIGLITFDNDFKIIISPKLSENNIARIQIETEKVYIDNPSDEMLKNMHYHRTNIFKK